MTKVGNNFVTTSLEEVVQESPHKAYGYGSARWTQGWCYPQTTTNTHQLNLCPPSALRVPSSMVAKKSIELGMEKVSPPPWCFTYWLKLKFSRAL